MLQLNLLELLPILRIIWLLITLTAFFLSLWIVLPAPNSLFLFLSVGTPEISAWLIVIQAMSLMIRLINCDLNLFSDVIIFCHLIGVGLSLLPLIQFAKVNARCTAQMEAQLGKHYLTSIPDSVKAQMRRKPLILKDLFLGIPLETIRIERGIKFARLDGIDLRLNIYKPLSVGKYPSIVVIYGGGWRNGSPNNDESFSRYMAHQGYTVIAIDYRHSPEYRFPTQLNDVQLALKYIKNNALDLEIDLAKMAIMGRSAGGHLALLTGYENEFITFQGVVDYYGPINLTHAYRNLPFPDPIDTRAVLQDFLGGNPDQLPDLYQQASPINHLKPNLPPTLLIYPQRDHIVQVTAGKKMAQKLLESGNCAIFLEIDWADHGFDNVFFGISNQLALYYSERFLASVLRSYK